MATLRLLIVEDDPTDAELVVRELRKSGFDPAIRRVATREAFLSALSDDRPDVIIYDHNLPQFSSSEALQLAQHADLGIPFIIVSHAIGDEEAVALMRGGAADYLLKDRLGRLGESVRHALEQRRLREEHAAARNAIVSLNAELELRIASRTAQLKVANHALEMELGQRKRAEEALRRLNADLEQRVAERTRDLVASNHRLQALASELTLAEQRERKRLASELHDYLAQILALGRIKMSQLRQKVSGQPPAVPQLVAEIDSLLDKAGEYTRSLMAKLNPPVLDELGLPSALNWLAKQMPLHGLLVDVRLSQDRVPLPDDQAVLLFQSVRELLINVAKHAGTDRAVVSLTVDPDQQLIIEVRDEGRGFDPLAMEAKSENGHFGLFSVKERMQAMGGRLDVKSRPGEGATITMSLPLAKRQPAAADTPADRYTAGKEAEPASDETIFQIANPPFHPPPGNTIRLLLVDDHTMVRQGLRSLLESYEDVVIVGEGSNGEEAIELVEQLRPALVVMDLNMPKKNGIEATARIKARWPETVVIGLSVQAGEEARRAILNAGGAVLLTKEAAVDELYRTIREVLDGDGKGMAEVR
ncbi:MAG TPA: response regulator [Nitrospira sp.]|nr:response regulator [Nitrospira sp.]